MKQLTIQIQDSKYPFIVELMQQFDFISFTSDTLLSKEGDSEEDIMKNIRQGVEELRLINQGKLKARPARELLNEL